DGGRLLEAGEAVVASPAQEVLEAEHRLEGARPLDRAGRHEEAEEADDDRGQEPADQTGDGPGRGVRERAERPDLAGDRTPQEPGVAYLAWVVAVVSPLEQGGEDVVHEDVRREPPLEPGEADARLATPEHRHEEPPLVPGERRPRACRMLALEDV